MARRPPRRGVALTQGPPIWYGLSQPYKMQTTNKGTARARKNHTLQFLSRKPFFVTRQTPRAPSASYSLKPAESLSRCPHTRQGLKALLGASRHLSQLISAAYRSQPQKPAKINHPIDFLNNWPPSIDSASLVSLVTIVYNRLPIDSPVFRSTIRGMRIAHTIRDTDQSGRNDHHFLSDKECLWFRRE